MSIFDDSTSAFNPNVEDVQEPGENPNLMGAEVNFNLATPAPLSPGQAVTDGLGGVLDQE